MPVSAAAVPAVMRHMWATPIFSANLFTMTPAPELSIAANLQAYGKSVLDRYQAFPASDSGGLNLADLLYPADQKEELQYKKCVEQGLPNCKPVYPFRYQLIEVFYNLASQYLVECGLGGVDIPSSGRDLDLAFSMWASVHANGSHHLAHHHQNSLLSGVLYVSVPEGSGDFVAHDPRGQLPPFGRSQHFPPKPGDVLLFPGWLVHSVLPTLGAAPRVSISFNLYGSWEQTTDVNIGYTT